MQLLNMFHFHKPMRFQGLGLPNDGEYLCPDDPLDILLMTELLRHGAKVNHADKLVSLMYNSKTAVRHVNASLEHLWTILELLQ